ncbi:MAG: phosphoglycerate mutase (2,3-diphosphoglycerate-independent) [Spirochaetes bacterium GWF1_31_7]|nr:MAG: phosphoglycerate mutase (2,3-diphosphoglycerate-independent) [Spirochaetes bacterium GWE1_32_154]OHD50031.1 MAG: phosphoglycerate mutase (2,3-diphosphoglycerate-independent) [Spirochaetes bacterium GWE2_31_10]OHD52345.1 MAG: phosphoglycerate mutase (2,3-diphosphoglycerate-independent) [Spirochaetes bacterium GWF1_31_7]OHD83171.1 MAG: phosphoglycerate mutase (2,3-diphosphoglycerate-independent) [Spirochaetes bacterium RIFOXYB1_FULL_32_8]HBI38496.1 2,3-bisphosphoglycerate-independent phos
MAKKPYVLIIRDGWGYNPDFRYNAVYNAETPNHDKYVEDYPTVLIVPSGENVGLPSGNQGSSEVGHLNMGAGRIVYQSLVKISKTIIDGDFFKMKSFIDPMMKVKEKGSVLHIWGLVQDQGVHSHNEHCIALIKLASQLGLKKEQVLVHVFSDGRDTPPKSVEGYVKELDDAMKKFGVGIFASVVGRYFAMDRDNNYERVKLAYDMLTEGKADGPFENIYQAIENGYNKEENDEFIKPRLIKGFKPVSDNDTVIFFNYRLDRTRELTKAFVQDDFKEFPVKNIKNLDYVCFAEYYDGVANSTRAKVTIAFGNADLTNLFGQYCADNGLKQLRIAETEKFAHVTFFFNGQSDIIFKDEDRILVPSPKVATYDMQPEMSAYEVRDKAVEAVKSGKYDVIILNYANPDMVGHTGVFDAAVKACSVVDECVGSVVDAVVSMDGVAFVTADHGNAEQMIDYVSNKPMTSHTTNLVWFSLISKRPELQKGAIALKATGGKLADVIPTMIEVMGMKKVDEMEGETLIIKV